MSGGSNADVGLKYREYVGTFNLNLLGEELVAAFPEWIRDGETKAKIVSDGKGVRISYDETITNESRLDQVVSKHDALGKSKNEKDKVKHDKDRADGIHKLKGLGLSNDEIEVLIGK